MQGEIAVSTFDCASIRLHKRQLGLVAAAIRLYQYNGVPGTKASKAAQN